MCKRRGRVPRVPGAGEHANRAGIFGDITVVRNRNPSLQRAAAAYESIVMYKHMCMWGNVRSFCATVQVEFETPDKSRPVRAVTGTTSI